MLPPVGENTTRVSDRGNYDIRVLRLAKQIICWGLLSCSECNFEPDCDWTIWKTDASLFGNHLNQFGGSSASFTVGLTIDSLYVHLRPQLAEIINGESATCPSWPQLGDIPLDSILH